MKYFQRIHEYLQAGFEAIILPAAIREDESLRYEDITTSTSGRAGIFVIGSPNSLVEPGINVPLTRTSTDIWYDLDLRFDIVGNYASFSLENSDASAFPSNRVWINEVLKEDYQQGALVKLWQSSPIYGLHMVAGRHELGVFERQSYLFIDGFWIPLEF